MSNLYTVLGVQKDATLEDIKRAYREKAKKYHPDRNIGDKEAEEKFKEIQRAYEILGDKNKRREYDQRNNRQQSPFGFGFDIFEQFFSRSSRGANIQTTVDISLEEVLTGTTKSVSIKGQSKCRECEGFGWSHWNACSYCFGSGKTVVKQSPFNIFITCQGCGGSGRHGTVKCQSCSGTGLDSEDNKVLNVNIPAGIEDGTRIQIAGEGEPGEVDGDLYVIVRVKEHLHFKRYGNNLIKEIFVPYSQMVLGTKLQTKTLDGTEVEFNIPAGTQSHTHIRLASCGLPTMNTGKKGDMIVVVKVIIPKDISKEYEKKLFQLQKMEIK